MNLQELTPVEIDTLLAESYLQLHANKDRSSLVKRRIQNLNTSSHSYDSRIESFSTELSTLRDTATQLETEISQYEGEYQRRNRWTRYFIVGHLHTSNSCSSFRSTTQVMWLPEYSGRTEAEMISLAGDMVCTKCVPDAPTQTKRPTLPVLAEAWDKAHLDDSCPGSGQRMNRDLPYRDGFAYGNWATCPECRGEVSFTSLGLLRRHKRANA